MVGFTPVLMYVAPPFWTQSPSILYTVNIYKWLFTKSDVSFNTFYFNRFYRGDNVLGIHADTGVEYNTYLYVLSNSRNILDLLFPIHFGI